MAALMAALIAALALLAAGAHLLYAPNVEEMYPPGYGTNVSVSGVSEGLCGAARPGHFDGVSTVCSKLFLQSGADGAFFGEKDFQQLQVVRRFVRDLNIPIEIHPCPTVREADGLALSSRNKLLPAEARAKAPALHRAMQAAAARLRSGAAAADALAEAERETRTAGFGPIDYIELRSSPELAPIERALPGARIFAAAWLGDVRLIDNIEVSPVRGPADI
ncbi:MAG: pantoate--beta-alanine ligase [Alphaproteobacteria bacterium]